MMYVDGLREAMDRFGKNSRQVAAAMRALQRVLDGEVPFPAEFDGLVDPNTAWEGYACASA